ncbi:leucine-rich repeat domain-containing protein [Acinetobacter indicus]|uniref:leucine-rich repeat domain-containing protein n=1 Tax=Acinetobacter indicus TaxID=756892 RepID=UPI002574D003|nr:leucine-rich repeat domain-containing protein [Acinetobacter indicus]MDM1491598.1 leucine-rich repeat domain-containing protein [Acinetobacter indicus]
MSNNKITQIENLEVLTDLIELNLGDNNIEEIKNINKLKSLEIINLTNNNIIEIYNLENCTNLKYLYLGSNKIKEIKGLETLSNLIHIHLYHNNITKLDNLHNLKNLEVIFLGGNKISKIENLDTLKNLKILNIYENRIKYLENLDKNIKLEELVIHDNPLENINFLDKLQNLHTLHLGRTSLKSINEVRHLINLETFTCENNNITDITPLLELKKLSYLILGKNKIKKLKNIENLKSLKVLDLSNNLISNEDEIEKIKLLPNLRNLKINDNPIWKNYDIYLDWKWDSNHLEFFNVFINEYKNYEEINLPYNVVLLGNHSSGKSSLLKILTGKKYNNQSTHGLKIEFSPQKNRDFPICVYYDFGGQDFYHGIYRLFLRENSIKVLVINPENNQNKLRKENINTVIENQKYVQDFTIDYWSKQIDFNDISKKNTSDIHLIQSHYNKNKIKNWEYISSITKKRLNTFSALDLSNSKSPENIYFKNYLLRQITDVNSKVKISNTRIQLMKDILENIKRIEKKQSEPIPILELKNKYESLSYPLESFRIDLDQLSASGLIFYDKKIANGEYVWLNPKALVNEIFNKILSQELIRNQEKCGILKQEVFERLNINKYTLELLEYYNIIFKHQPNKNQTNTIEYIIPNYLPLIDQDNPIFFLSSFGFTNPTFTLKFLKFIPMGLINHLICFFGKQPDHKLFWRDLIIFSLSEGLKHPFRIMINLD